MFGLVPFGTRKDLAANNSPRSIWDVFDEPFFSDDFFPTMSGMTSAGAMRVDVKDNGDSFELTADLPGMKKEDVNLTYQNGYLTIAAQPQAENNQQDDKGNYIRRERRMGSVSRSFYIDNIDESRIDAEFKDGVLTVKEIEHVWGEPTYDWSDDNRLVTAKCVDTLDSSIVQTETSVAKATVTKQATCTEEGETTFEATFENEAFETQRKTIDIPVDSEAHQWRNWTVTKEPTTTDPGEATRVCDFDSDHVQKYEIPATDAGYEYKHVEAKEPTCDEDGCIEHWVVDQAEGRKYFVAIDNDVDKKVEVEEEDVVVKALGHIDGAVAHELIAPATCEESGAYEGVVYCDNCGKELYRSPEPIAIAPLGHDWGEWVVTKEATETEEGLETRTCSRCDKTETRPIDKLEPETPDKPVYSVVVGDRATWTKGSSEGLSFTFKRSYDDKTTFSHFKGIKVNGADVAATNYDAESGSVIVTLHPSYLETLAPGGYEIAAQFDDGDEAPATFKVKAVTPTPDGDGSDDSGEDGTQPDKSSADGTGTGGSAGKAKSSSTSAPGTGDNNGVIIVVLVVVVVVALGVVLFAFLKGRHKSGTDKHTKQ